MTNNNYYQRSTYLKTHLNQRQTKATTKLQIST